MPNIRIDIDNVSEGSDWSGQVTINSTDMSDKITPDGDGNFIDWKFPAGGTGVNFSTDNSLKFPSTTGADQNYVTFRSQVNVTTQFPTPQTGISFDVWSDAFHSYIVNNDPTWQNLVDADNTYNLSTDKFTLIYDYDNLYAPYYSKGGTIRFYIPT